MKAVLLLEIREVLPEAPAIVLDILPRLKTGDSYR